VVIVLPNCAIALQDISHDGKIAYCEFLAAVLEARSNIDEERVADCFDHLDNSNTGYISKDDLASVLGKDYNHEEIKQLIREADTDKDGQSKFITIVFVAASSENTHQLAAFVYQSPTRNSRLFSVRTRRN
jgi:Ca2+-binding EF-hand superfamily protein